MTKVKKAKTRKRRSKAETFALFLELRKEKASIKEVAKAMGVTSNYLYKTIIPELAEYMHVDRNTFLFAPQCSTRNAKTQENVKVETETVETETIEAETVVTGTVEEDTVENLAAEADVAAKPAVEDVIVEDTTAEDTTVEDTTAEEESASEEGAKEEIYSIPNNEMLMEIINILAETKAIIKNINVFLGG